MRCRCRATIAAESRRALASHSRDDSGRVDPANVIVDLVRNEYVPVGVHRDGPRIAEDGRRRSTLTVKATGVTVARHRGDDPRSVDPADATVSGVRDEEIADTVDRHVSRAVELSRYGR